MSHGIVCLERPPRDRQRLREAALVEALQRDHAQPDEAWPGLGLRLGQRGETLREVAQVATSDVDRGPLAVEGRDLQGRVAQLVGQGQGPLEGTHGRRRLVASVRDQRLPQLQLQPLLAPFPARPVAQGATEPDGALEARDGLLVGGTRQGLDSGLFPVVEGPLGQTCRLRVLRLDRGWRLAGVLQHVEQAGMQSEALRLEQALVGGIADQGVLEEICGLGRCAPPEHQLRLHEASHRLRQLGLGPGGEGGDGAVVEGAADDGGGLGHGLDGLKAVEPGHQRVVQGGGNGQSAQGAVEAIRIGVLAEHGRLDHRLGHLLDEEGDTIGPRCDLLEEDLWQPFAARDARDDGLCRRAGEPVQGQPRHHRVAGE